VVWLMAVFGTWAAGQAKRDCAESAYQFAGGELYGILYAEQVYAREHPEEGYSKDLNALYSGLGAAAHCATPPCTVNGYRYTYRRLSKSKFRATATPLFPQVKSMELGMFPPTLIVDESGFVHPIGIHWPRKRPNEWKAILTLEKLSSDEVTYASFHPEMGYSLDMEALGAGPNGELGAEHPGVLEATMVCTGSRCEKDGYTFTYTRSSKGGFTVVARPMRYGETGRFSFYMDQDGVVHATADHRGATAKDLMVSSREYRQQEAEKQEKVRQNELAAKLAAPPQIVFVEDPKPLPNIETGNPEPSFEMTARVVSTRPLMFDVLDLDASMKREAEGSCGFQFLPFVDAKLKPVLGRLKFNQVVGLKLFFGGSFQSPMIVLSELALDARPESGAGVCPNRSGIAVSYRGVVEYLNIYNDGSISFRDGQLNSFGTQKLSHDEMAQLLKAFDDSSFDQLPSSTTPMGAADSNSITLGYKRYRHVSVSGLDAKDDPLLQRLDAVKARATSQTFYLLVTNGRKKLNILDWPFRQVRLSQLEIRKNAPAAIHDSVPEEFLSKLPQVQIIGTSAPAPDVYTYVDDDGALYWVLRNACFGSPAHCTAFEDLAARRIERPGAVLLRTSGKSLGVGFSSWSGFSSPAGLFWPSDLGIDIAHVGPEGHRITNEDYERQQPFYSNLYENSVSGMGYSFIDDGYIYEGVRICRVDPQAPVSTCLKPINPDVQAH